MGSQEDIFPKLLDRSVLDCSICLLPLTIPVFQCENGHIICSSCLERLENPKCPTCSCDHLGNIRNRAMEQVLASVTDLCAYRSIGCTAGQLMYSAKRSHERTCAYAPYQCSRCLFHGSPTDLYKHLEKAHPTESFLFRYGSKLTIKKEIKFVHLLDYKENGSVIYILHMRTMKMYSLQDPKFNSIPPRYPYLLAAQTASYYFEFRPTMVICRSPNDATWNAPVTDADRTDEALILDCMFKNNPTIILHMMVPEDNRSY